MMLYIFFISLLMISLLALVTSVKNNKIMIFDEKYSFVAIAKRTPMKTKLMLFFTKIGTSKYVTLICITLFLLSNKGEIYPMVASIGAIITIPISKYFKKSISRIRPNNARLVEEIDHSFPSSHAMTAAALYGGIIINYVNPSSIIYFSVIIICILFILIIGYSRVYLGIHYPSDVLGGWLTGFIIAISLSLIFNFL